MGYKKCDEWFYTLLRVMWVFSLVSMYILGKFPLQHGLN